MTEVDRRGAVVIGASTGVGRALAEELAARGWDLVVAARDERELARLAADLELRHRTRATVLPLDLRSPDDELERWLRACHEALPDPDAVLVPAGVVDDADDGLADWAMETDLLTTNFIGVLKLAGRFAVGFEQRGSGTLVLFSSIAAAAPRQRNVVYAAAKAALESYGRSLQHRFADTDVRVQVHALGYVDTAMTAGRSLRLRPVAPERVARHVIDGLDGPGRVSYYPSYWGVLTRLLRVLPRRIYHRLDF